MQQLIKMIDIKFCLLLLIYYLVSVPFNHQYLSHDMRFPTMWYVRPAKAQTSYAYAQTDQSLCWSLEYSMTVKLLTEQFLEFLSLTRGCTGPSESTLVKMPHCWKSHVTAHLWIIFKACSCFQWKSKKISQSWSCANGDRETKWVKAHWWSGGGDWDCWTKTSPGIVAETAEYKNFTTTVRNHLSRDMWFPTMWHFDKSRLRWACAASFLAERLQMMFGQ